MRRHRSEHPLVIAIGMRAVALGRLRRGFRRRRNARSSPSFHGQRRDSGLTCSWTYLPSTSNEVPSRQTRSKQVCSTICWVSRSNSSSVSQASKPFLPPNPRNKTCDTAKYPHLIPLGGWAYEWSLEVAQVVGGWVPLVTTLRGPLQAPLTPYPSCY